MFTLIGNYIGQSQPASSGSSGDTTADGYQVHWVTVSDSIYNGTGTADITIPAGILYLWNGTGLTEITNQNISNDVVSGSPWKTYAVQYVADHPGKKVVLVQNAKGGSNLGPDGVDQINWSSTGNLRGPSEAAVDAALAFLGLSYPVCIMCDAMINDVRVPQTISTLASYFDECINRLVSKFPLSPILYSIPGKNGSSANTLLLRQARDLIIQRSRTVPNLYLASQSLSFDTLVYYQADNLHPIQAGSEYLGACNARWHVNSAYSKYARGIISMHFGSLTTYKKGLIANEIDTIGSSLTTGFEFYLGSRTTDDRDSFLDYTLLTSPSNSGTTYTIDDCRTSNGTTFMRTAYIASTMSIRTSQNDFCISIYVKTMRSDTLTIRTAVGVSDGTKQTTIGHTTTGVFYRINDNTLTLAPELRIADNSEYVGIRESSTQKVLYKNGAEFHRATVTSLAPVSQSPTVGVLNNSGSPVQGADMDYYGMYIAAPSLINITTVYNARKTRIDNWNL